MVHGHKKTDDANKIKMGQSFDCPWGGLLLLARTPEGVNLSAHEVHDDILPFLSCTHTRTNPFSLRCCTAPTGV